MDFNYFKLLVKAIENTSDFENLKVKIGQAKDEIATMKESPLNQVRLIGVKSSTMVPEHVITLLSILEHVTYRKSCPAVLVVILAYLRRQPEILDSLEGMFAKPAEVVEVVTENDCQEKNDILPEKKFRKKRKS